MARLVGLLPQRLCVRSGSARQTAPRQSHQAHPQLPTHPRGRAAPAWTLGWGQSLRGAAAAGRLPCRTAPCPPPCRCIGAWWVGKVFSSRHVFSCMQATQATAVQLLPPAAAAAPHRTLLAVLPSYKLPLLQLHGSPLAKQAQFWYSQQLLVTVQAPARTHMAGGADGMSRLGSCKMGWRGSCRARRSSNQALQPIPMQAAA